MQYAGYMQVFYAFRRTPLQVQDLEVNPYDPSGTRVLWVCGTTQRVTPLGQLWAELTVRPGPTLHMLHALHAFVERRGLLPHLGGVGQAAVGTWTPILLVDPNPPNPPDRVEPPLTQRYNRATDPTRIPPQPKPSPEARQFIPTGHQSFHM